MTIPSERPEHAVRESVIAGILGFLGDRDLLTAPCDPRGAHGGCEDPPYANLGYPLVRHTFPVDPSTLWPARDVLRLARDEAQ
jgi:hypothetical protein